MSNEHEAVRPLGCSVEEWQQFCERFDGLIPDSHLVNAYHYSQKGYDGHRISGEFPILAIGPLVQESLIFSATSHPWIFYTPAYKTRQGLPQIDFRTLATHHLLVNDVPKDEICSTLGLTANDFRNVKNCLLVHGLAIGKVTPSRSQNSRFEAKPVEQNELAQQAYQKLLDRIAPLTLEQATVLSVVVGLQATSAPSFSDIAKASALGNGTVADALADLAELGLVSVSEGETYSSRKTVHHLNSLPVTEVPDLPKVGEELSRIAAECYGLISDKLDPKLAKAYADLSSEDFGTRVLAQALLVANKPKISQLWKEVDEATAERVQRAFGNLLPYLEGTNLTTFVSQGLPNSLAGAAIRAFNKSL